MYRSLLHFFLFLSVSNPVPEALAAPDEDGRGTDQQKLVGAYAENLAEAKLVPAGFQLAGKAKGDLTGDGRDDIAVVIHRDLSPENEEEPFAHYDLPQFVVLFEGLPDNRYKLLALGDRHFENSMPNQMTENGLAQLSIKKGVLILASDFALSMGGWSAGGCTQRWRKNKDGFALIGLTVDSSDRKCGECGTKKDINFSTGQQILKTISEDGTPQKTKKSKIGEGPVPWEKFDHDRRCRS